MDHNVIDLLPSRTEPRTIAQVLMESPLIIRIYESRLWRRSLWMTAITGISFDCEYSLIETSAELHGNETLLDLACGPGIYARPFARKLPTGTVVGLDLSLPMLCYASQRAEQEGLKNFQMVHGDAMDLPFESGCFDVVNCCGALHLFPNVPQVLSEIYRVLCPGGHFAVATLRRGESKLAEWRSRMRRVLYGIDSFTRSDLAAKLHQAGFTSITCLHSRALWLLMGARRP